MMQQRDTIKKMEIWLSKLADLIMCVRVNMGIFETIQEQCKQKPEYNELLNQSIIFWHMVVISIRTRMIMDLSRIYDKSRDVISLSELNKFCEKNEHSLIVLFEEQKEKK